MLLNGKELSTKIKDDLRVHIRNKAYDNPPGLGVIIVGDRKDSLTYVKMKKRVCDDMGIVSKTIHLSENSSTENVISAVDIFNTDNSIHGILVQLPLPNHVDEEMVLTRVDINKDVDGFHSSNIGNLAMERRKPLFTPCTPLGCIRLLDEYDIDVKGKNAVVIGKSNIVGLPISLMLMKRNATVTVCHIFTEDVKSIVQRADILVSACGQAQMVKGDWLKEGVVVVDIGISHIPDPEDPEKTIIVGDVDFEEAKEKASYITPVPGGVGPMTIAMLMENTFTAYCKSKNIR